MNEYLVTVSVNAFAGSPEEAIKNVQGGIVDVALNTRYFDLWNIACITVEPYPIQLEEDDS